MSDLAEPLTGITPAKQQHLMTGYLLYLAAAFLFALNGTVAKSLLLTGIEATRLSQIRVSSAFLLLLVLVAITRPAALRITKKELPVLLVYGVIGVGMTQYLYFVALQTLPVGVALLIEFTAPIMVALWFRFGMKQATRKSVWIALVLALTGLAMVAQVWLGFTLSAVGVTAGFGAAIALAIYYVLADKQLRSAHPRDAVSLTMWGFGASAAFWAIVQPWWSFPWASLTGIGYPLGTDDDAFPIWVLLTYLIVLGTTVPFLLVVHSMRHIRASQASVIGMVEPLIAIAIAWLALGEVMTPVQIIGALIVLFGVVLAERSR